MQVCKYISDSDLFEYPFTPNDSAAKLVLQTANSTVFKQLNNLFQVDIKIHPALLILNNEEQWSTAKQIATAALSFKDDVIDTNVNKLFDNKTLISDLYKIQVALSDEELKPRFWQALGCEDDSSYIYLCSIFIVAAALTYDESL